MWHNTVRAISHDLELERAMFECNVAAYNDVLKKAADFPECLPAFLLISVAMTAAAIEDFELKLEAAEMREAYDLWE